MQTAAGRDGTRCTCAAVCKPVVMQAVTQKPFQNNFTITDRHNFNSKKVSTATLKTSKKSKLETARTAFQNLSVPVGGDWILLWSAGRMLVTLLDTVIIVAAAGAHLVLGDALPRTLLPCRHAIAFAGKLSCTHVHT